MKHDSMTRPDPDSINNNEKKAGYIFVYIIKDTAKINYAFTPLLVQQNIMEKHSFT